MGRGFEGRAAAKEEGGTWELYHSNILAKSSFFSTLSYDISAFSFFLFFL